MKGQSCLDITIGINMAEPHNPFRSKSRTATHPGGYAAGTGDLAEAKVPAEPSALPPDSMLAWVRKNIYGHDLQVPGPFGPHPRRYFDYTASGLPFRPIEEMLQKHV